MNEDAGQNGLHPLARVRQDLGLTQIELAQASGQPRGTIAAIEAGATRGIGVALRYALRALGLDDAELQRLTADWYESRGAQLARDLAQRQPPPPRPWHRGDLHEEPPDAAGTP